MELLSGIDGDHLDAERADGVVVAVARPSRRDDLGPQAGKVRQLLNSFGVASRQAGRSGVGESGGTTGGDDGRFALNQLREPLADAFHQLVNVDREVRCLFHGLLDLRQRKQATIHRDGGGQVDERPDADATVDIGTGGLTSSRGCYGRSGGTEQAGGCETTIAKDVSARRQAAGPLGLGSHTGNSLGRWITFRGQRSTLGRRKKTGCCFVFANTLLCGRQR